MDKLTELLHELVDGSTGQGNERGHLHGLVNAALAELEAVIAEKVAAALGVAEASVKPLAPAAPAVFAPPTLPRASGPAKP